jgi:hypothetical protein
VVLGQTVGAVTGIDQRVTYGSEHGPATVDELGLLEADQGGGVLAQLSGVEAVVTAASQNDTKTQLPGVTKRSGVDLSCSALQASQALPMCSPLSLCPVARLLYSRRIDQTCSEHCIRTTFPKNVTSTRNEARNIAAIHMSSLKRSRRAFMETLYCP